MANFENWHLKAARMDNYGGCSDRTVGPFKPGMNVVYGPNESGKTTFTSFVGGVLFGWPDARSNRNAYKPANAERAGALIFENEAGEESVLYRARNADGVMGDEEFVDDIDPETFGTVFSLNSDELLKLGGTADMASRLLTAGAGTVVSPAKALENLDARIASYTSRSAAATHSITNLTAKRDDLADELAEFGKQMETCRAEDEELRKLEPRVENLRSRLSNLNGLMDKLSGAKAMILGNSEKQQSLGERKSGLNANAEEAARERDTLSTSFEESSGMVTLDAAKERSVRAALDDLEAQSERLEAAASAAKNDYLNSSSQYQVFEETSQSGQGVGRTPFRRTLMLGFAVLFPIVSLVAGVFCLMKGSEIVSLYVTFVGVALILFALALAGGVAVIALRPNKKEQVFEKRMEDAKWVMLQDEKRLHSCMEDLERHNEKIASYLSFNGLSAAEGSIRRARVLLDSMRENRQKVELSEQRRVGYVSQLADVNREAQTLRMRDAEILRECGCDSMQELETVISSAETNRASVSHELQKTQKRLGELQQKLDSVRGNRDFDKMKLELEQVKARLVRSKMDYACLLLARKRLAEAIEVWDKNSQPAVFSQAGEFLSTMTDGKWVKVAVSEEGDVVVSDTQGRVRSAAFLSTGTCQQLFLSIRMALLNTAGNVGTRVPILADDILVNFDNQRRINTARALLDLARSRQIFLMTCHEEIAATFLGLDPEVNVVCLGESGETYLI